MPGTISKSMWAAEKQRIATFETDNDFVFACGVNQQGVDFGLGEQAMAGAFADVDALRGGGNQPEDFAGDERVVENDVRGFEEARGFSREEIGVAGARAEEEDFTGQGGLSVACRSGRTMRRPGEISRFAEFARNGGGIFDR